MPSLRVLLAVLLIGAACTSLSGPSEGGDPEGLKALPDEVRYVALGDSIAVGAGATTSYVEEFAARIESELGRQVMVANLASNGWTAGDLLHALRTDGAMREAVAGADLLTWNIGGNDLLRVLAEIAAGTCEEDRVEDCVGGTVDTLIEQWDDIVAEIAALSDDGVVVLRAVDIYHPFVSEHRQAGVFDTLAPYLDKVNRHLADTSGQHSIRVAGVHQAFNGPDGTEDPAAKGLLAADGVHPSDAGQALIAEVLFELG